VKSIPKASRFLFKKTNGWGAGAGESMKALGTRDARRTGRKPRFEAAKYLFLMVSGSERNRSPQLKPDHKTVSHETVSILELPSRDPEDLDCNVGAGAVAWSWLIYNSFGRS